MSEKKLSENQENNLSINNMGDLLPVGRLGDEIILVNRSDTSHIGKEDSLKVMSVVIDLVKKNIKSIWPLEQHMTHNPWEEIPQDDIDRYVNKIKSDFDNNLIVEKVIKPLFEARIYIKQQSHN